jgi:GNAT superfamily N-acetyltransferase
MLAVTLHDTLDSIPRLEALLELLRAQLPKTDVRSSLARALLPGSPARLLVLSEAGSAEPVGFAFFNIGSGLESGGDYLWLNEIHVSPQYRGQGGGRKMMDYLADWARHNRIQAICGVCSVSNHGAQSFYRRLGFATEQACWLSKRLESPKSTKSIRWSVLAARPRCGSLR